MSHPSCSFAVGLELPLHRNSTRDLFCHMQASSEGLPRGFPSELARVKIHELHRAARVAEAEGTARGRVRWEREALRLLAVAFDRHLAAVDGDDEPMITARRR